MIEEKQDIIIEGDSEKTVSIKGNGFNLVLAFKKNHVLEDIWVYENDNKWLTYASAHYNCEGNLISKNLFSYDENNNMIEYTNFDHENILNNRTVYENDDKGRLKIARCFDREGNLEYTFEKQWDGFTCTETIYFDANGNKITEPTP
jgi:hypothetical protein